MALTEYRVGALHVVQDVHDAGWISRKLQAIDANLFLEKQLTHEQEWVWCVVEDTGREDRPDRFVTVFEWRDQIGRPIPYPTEGIVAEFERRRALGGGAPRSMERVQADVNEANEKRRAKQNEEIREAREDLVREDMKILRRLPAEKRPSALLTGEFDHALRQEERRIEARRLRRQGIVP